MTAISCNKIFSKSEMGFYDPTGVCSTIDIWIFRLAKARLLRGIISNGKEKAQTSANWFLTHYDEIEIQPRSKSLGLARLIGELEPECEI